MPKYQLSSKAVEDLTNIWNYTLVKWSEEQADKYYNLLIDTFVEISKNPELGKDYSDIFESVLGFKVGRHIIFYRIVHRKDIEIIRILHERMDLEVRLMEK